MKTVLSYVGPQTNGNLEPTVNFVQHHNAVENGKTNAHGRAMMHMLRGWEEYAKAFEKTYECKIGTDGVIGDYWANAGLALKRLLDGETGWLDCGSIAANITRIIEENGIKTDGYSVVG